MTPTDYVTAQEAAALEAKRRAALEYLGERWVLHPNYRPRLPQHGSTLESMRPLWVRKRGVD